MPRLKHYPFWPSERGFTLPEVLIVVVLMGIVLAIATSSLFGVVESRQVDSATNQMVSDLRLAHTSATNRLENWQVVLDGDSTYQIGPSAELRTRTLPDGADVDTSVTFTFKPNGSVSGSPTTFKVRAADGAPDHDIEINAMTSRVRVVD